jgi:phosphoribosyl 1,2-cyclic phosphate phosphodiesterase
VVWPIPAISTASHPSHFCLDDALLWVERIGPKRAILTNLHSDMDYGALCARLPANVEPAYDGMRFTVPVTGL